MRRRTHTSRLFLSLARYRRVLVTQDGYDMLAPQGEEEEAADGEGPTLASLLRNYFRVIGAWCCALRSTNRDACVQ